MRRGTYDPGPDCVVCGNKRINVVHDDLVTRQRNIEAWAGPSPSMNGEDYYTWANVTYHPFQAVKPEELGLGDDHAA